MSDVFIAAYCFRKSGTQPDWSVGEAFINAMEPGALVGYGEHAQGEPWDEDEDARKHLQRMLQIVKSDMEDYALIVECPGGHEFWVAGGMSNGDDPCEEFTALNNLLNGAPGLMGSMGFYFSNLEPA